jgi:hypothetical protein
MEKEKKQPEKPKFIWVKPKETTPEIYTNYIHVSWTLFDVRVQLGHLIPTGEELTSGFAVEQLGAVTFAWAEAKALRDVLTNVVAKYEQANGEIKPLKLPPST